MHTHRHSSGVETAGQQTSSLPGLLGLDVENKGKSCEDDQPCGESQENRLNKDKVWANTQDTLGAGEGVWGCGETASPRG